MTTAGLVAGIRGVVAVAWPCDFEFLVVAESTDLQGRLWLALNSQRFYVLA